MDKLIKELLQKDISELKKIIASGININAACIYGMTALMYASRYGYKDCVKTLLDAGANIHRRDNSHMSALMHAVNCNQAECAKLILNANKQFYDQCLKDALMIAERYKYQDCADLINAKLKEQSK